MHNITVPYKIKTDVISAIKYFKCALFANFIDCKHFVTHHVAFCVCLNVNVWAPVACIGAVLGVCSLSGYPMRTQGTPLTPISWNECPLERLLLISSLNFTRINFAEAI